MSAIEIKFNVQIGVTEQLAELLKSLATSTKINTWNVTEIKPNSAAEAADTTSVPSVPSTQEEQKPEEAAEAAAPTQEEEKEYTTVDVRAAMDECRKRFEGEDYKESNSDAKKKWHKKLTEWFTLTAKNLGADKPSELKTSAERKTFIDMCASAVASADGNDIEL